MYTILINNDNTMEATQKQRIIQRSKLVDEFQFLVLPAYNGFSMADSTVLMEYLKPVSREYKTEILVKSPDMYKEYLVYKLPLDTEFTKEAGSLEIQLSFIFADIDENGNVIQKVRKISPAINVEIIPISAWADIIPDNALSPIDQRIIMQSAQIKALDELTARLEDIQGGGGCACDEEGVPIIVFGANEESGNQPEDDNIVEF